MALFFCGRGPIPETSGWGFDKVVPFLLYRHKLSGLQIEGVLAYFMHLKRQKTHYWG
jgi:hypothetical protein